MSEVPVPSGTPSGSTPDPGRPASPVLPPRVPDHELLRRIGRGAYGEVWLARSVTGAFRAVKIVHRQSFDHDRPFEREFEGILKFEPISRKHDSQVDILHVGRGDDCFYYVMELADDQATGGQINPDKYTPRTLKSDLLFHGRLPFEECVRIGLALTTALENLHGHGLAHRDVKPSNIIFVNGVPKLADIGLVAGVEATRSYVGTEGFAAPEGPGSPQADLYSLGKVLYEISTGKDRQEFPELPTQLLELPDRDGLMELNAVIARACRHDPKDRYLSATVMRTDLELLQGGKSLARLHRTQAQLSFVRRAGAIVTVIAVLAAGLYLWQAKQTRKVRLLAEEKEQQRQLAEENLYFADIRVAYHHWESGQITGMLDLLRRHIPQAAAPDLRGWEWYYLLSLCHREERTLHGHDGAVLCVSSDPAGRRLASGGKDRTVRVWDVETGDAIAVLKGPEAAVRCVAWSPDGTRLASGGLDGKLRLWNVETREQLFALDCEAEVLSLAWSPDGKRVAAGGAGNLPEGSEGLVTIWDATAGSRLHYLTGEVGQVWSLAWQPTGHLLVAGENHHGRMQVWDADRGKLLHTVQAHTHYLSSLAWKPDGRQLASASHDQSVRIWNADTWKPTMTLEVAHDGMATSVVWSEDGQHLVSGGNDGLVKIWNPETGKLQNVLRGHQGPVQSVAWLQGKEMLISGSADGTLKLWKGENNQIVRTIAGFSSLAWSPDGRQIATEIRRNKAVDGSVTEGEGVIQIMELATWKTVRALPGETGTMTYPFAWSPDGQRLAARLTNSDLVRLWDLPTGREFLTLDPKQGGVGVWSIAWSPDARTLATGGEDHTVRLWNLEARTNVLKFVGHSNNVSTVLWHPDGRRIASKDWSGCVLIWAAASGRVLLKLQSPAGGQAEKQYNLTWSPAGDQLAVGCADGVILIWDAATGRELHALKGHTSPIRSVHWSPDGRRLVSGAEDRTIRIWDAQSGRELLVLPDPVHGRSMVSWSPSGRMIGVGENPAQIFDATLGYELASQLGAARRNR